MTNYNERLDEVMENDWLDDIMEDLIVGHNFDYAEKAIRKYIEEHYIKK